MGVVSANDDIRITRAIVGALREHDLSGFEIWRWLGVVHGAVGELDEASLYPTLYRMEVEGVLRSAWREDERARRTYRLTATGLKEAEARGWGAVGFRGPRDEPHASSGSGEGEWVWRPETGSAAPRGSNIHGPDVRRTDVHGPDEHRPDAPEAALVGDYLDRLQHSLQLSVLYCQDVCHEISDHIAASTARLRSLDTKPLEAAEQAVAGLGPPEELARGINEAHLTRERLVSGLRWGSGAGMFTALAYLVSIWAALVIIVPIVSGLLMTFAPIAGLHLYAPEVGDWHAEELGLAGCVGAFLGARKSMPQLALRSWRAESVVWPTWAALGAVPLTIAAILLPANLDPLTAATLLAIPLAWVLGTRRPAALHGDLLSTRGIVISALFVAAIMLLPGVRVWGYQPATTPPGGSSFSGEPISLTWDNLADRSVWHVGTKLEPGWHDPRLEVWRAVRSGLAVEPDPTVGGPAFVVDGDETRVSALLYGAPDWWVTVTAVGPDGQRHTVGTSVRLGAKDHYQGSILGWLLGRR